MALNLLPPKFNQLKITYNSQKEKWALDDLISICTQEEARIKRNEVFHTINMVHADNGKTVAYNSGKVPNLDNNLTSAPNASSSKGPVTHMEYMDKIKCYFCKKLGHMKRDCDKRKIWKNKKGVHKRNYNKKK